MNPDFQQIIDRMPVLMEWLRDARLHPWEDLGTLPQQGIYVFYEDETPLYVGRTNRMRERLKEHGRPSSRNNSAPFAFNIAKITDPVLQTIFEVYASLELKTPFNDFDTH